MALPALLTSLTEEPPQRLTASAPPDRQPAGRTALPSQAVADTRVKAAQAIRSDLTAAATQLRWAHNTAWWPGTTSDTPTRPPDTDDGPPWATGQPGDHTRRRLTQAIRRLARLETTLNTITTELRVPVPLVNPQPLDPWARHHRAIVLCGVRCHIIANTPHPSSVDTRRLLEHAARTSGSMRSLLDSALGASTPQTHQPPSPCWVCRLRAAERRKGGRCSTCHSWRHRHNAERPRHLDTDHHASLADARSAQARAWRRGEGWGAA